MRLLEQSLDIPACPVVVVAYSSFTPDLVKSSFFYFPRHSLSIVKVRMVVSSARDFLCQHNSIPCFQSFLIVTQIYASCRPQHDRLDLY